MVTGCGPDGTSVPPTPTTTSDTLALTLPRAVHRAVALPDGSVLLVGGCSTSGCGGFDEARTSELVDPASGRSRPGPIAGEPRASGTATTLVDGRVLLIGGFPGEGREPTAGIEVYDPETSSFSPFGTLRTARAGHSATVLPDGRVLVVGGSGVDGAALDSVEVVDPATALVSLGPPLPEPRAAHDAVLVDGRVLVVGGASRDDALSTTALLQGGAWVAGPELGTPRVKHAAVALRDGRVLVVGGSTSVEGRELLASTELVTLSDDPAPGMVRDGPTLAAGQYKLDGAVAVLPDGRVAIAGGSRLEVFDPADDTMATVDENRSHDGRS